MPDFPLDLYGVRPHDEGLHPADESNESWNESVFFDWVQDEAHAGHVRIGRMPGQGRVWVWIHLLHDGDWLVLEAPHLPIGSVDAFDVRVPGLSVTREVVTPLAKNRLTAEGTGRFVTGARTGTLASFSLDLVFDAAGPAHSIGESFIEGHASELSTSRFEQPMDASGTVRVGESTRTIRGLGERDHSWGPRDWNIAWTFLPVSRRDLRALAIRVAFDEESFLDLGYLQRAEMAHVFEIELALEHHDSVTAPFSGRARLVDEHGGALEGTITALSGTEIDLGHVLDGSRRSVYRRALVRLTPDDGSEPLLGFLEAHRYLDASKAAS